jgi:hypothetical protein
MLDSTDQEGDLALSPRGELVLMSIAVGAGFQLKMKVAYNTKHPESTVLSGIVRYGSR